MDEPVDTPQTPPLSPGSLSAPLARRSHPQPEARLERSNTLPPLRIRTAERGKAAEER